MHVEEGLRGRDRHEVQPHVMRPQSHCFSSTSFLPDFGPLLDGGWVAETLADAARLACMSPVRNFGQKAGHDIGNRDEDEEPKRSEGAHECDGRTERVDEERENVLRRLQPGGVKRLVGRPPLGNR